MPKVKIPRTLYRIRDSFRNRSLHRRILTTAGEDSVKAWQQIIEKNPAEVRNCRDREGNTPLHICVDSAARFGKQGTYVECARLLLRNGLSASQTNNSNRTPLMIATESNLHDMSALLAQYEMSARNKENKKHLALGVGSGPVARTTTASLNAKADFKCRLYHYDTEKKEYKSMARGTAKVQVKSSCLVFIDEGNEIVFTESMDASLSPDMSQVVFELAQATTVRITIHYKNKPAVVYALRCSHEDKELAVIEATRLYANLQRCRKVKK